MPKPLGTSRLKDNSRKKYHEAEAWAARKKLNRPKQRWVPVGFVEHTGQPYGGYWEKIPLDKVTS